MLQENRRTGLLFALGLFVEKWQYGLAAIVAAIAGTITAHAFNFGKKETDAGLYGFSAALVGVVLVFLFKESWTIWLLVIFGGSLASVLQFLFIRKNIPAYTFPFILVSWIIIYFLQNYTGIPATDLIQSKLDLGIYNALFIPTNGFGEVIFQSGKISGVLFFIGVLISTRPAAMYGLAASFLGALISLTLKQNVESVQLGLFGFNAVLTAIAFSGAKKINLLLIAIGTLITIFIHIALVEYHILDAVGGVLTFPFVAGTWITLIVQRMFKIKI